MRHSLFFRIAIFFALAAFLAAARPTLATAFVTAEAQLAHHDIPRAGQWELLEIRLRHALPGDTISIQDVRGGLIVSRPFSSATIDPATQEARLLIPLPFLTPADLPTGTWPINVTTTSSSGLRAIQQVEVSRLVLLNITPTGQSTFRLVVPSDSADVNPAAIPPHLTSLPIVLVPLSDEEILTGPSLLVASCDGLLLSPRLAAKLSDDRANALINVGLQLVATTDSSVVPALNPIAHPQVLEPHLASARTLHLYAAPTSFVLRVISALPLVALVALLLVRGLFRRPILILLSAAFAFAVLTFSTIAYIRSNAPPKTLDVTWTTRTTNPPLSFAVTESFTACSPLFTHHLRTTADQSTILFPVATTPRQYFSLQNATLSLDLVAPNGLDRVSQLDIALAPRDSIVYTTRSTATAASPPHFPSSGVWIDRGYISSTAPANPTASQPDSTILAQWASTHPDYANPLRVWYELRALPSHRYFLAIPGDHPANTLNILDLGANSSSGATPGD